MNKPGPFRTSYSPNHSEWFIMDSQKTSPLESVQGLLLELLGKRLSFSASDTKPMAIKYEFAGTHLCH